MSHEPEEDPTSQKRKISVSPEPEDVSAKRLKVEDEKHEENGTGIVNERGQEGDEVSKSAEEERRASEDERPGSQSPNDTKEEGEEDEDEPTSNRPPSKDEPNQPPAPSNGRKNFSLEEKKRGRRLFGGLLSTLNKSAPSTHQKKRLEIEKRQQERAHQQWVEDDKRRAEKLAKLTSIRKLEQIKFDEQVVRFQLEAH